MKKRHATISTRQQTSFAQLLFDTEEAFTVLKHQTNLWQPQVALRKLACFAQWITTIVCYSDKNEIICSYHQNHMFKMRDRKSSGIRSKYASVVPKVIPNFEAMSALRCRRIRDSRHLKQEDAFNRTWWSVLAIDKLVTWQHLSIERTGGHVVLKASSCLRFLVARLRNHTLKATTT